MDADGATRCLHPGRRRDNQRRGPRLQCRTVSRPAERTRDGEQRHAHQEQRIAPRTIAANAAAGDRAVGHPTEEWSATTTAWPSLRWTHRGSYGRPAHQESAETTEERVSPDGDSCVYLFAPLLLDALSSPNKGSVFKITLAHREQ